MCAASSHMAFLAAASDAPVVSTVNPSPILADATAISFFGPLMLTALSVPFLKEKVGPRRWAAVVVGFIGALIVVRPGHAEFDWHALLIVASTVCSSFYQLFSRRYGQTERPDA